MSWSWANIDWTDTGTVTGTWAQAIGTIIAIYFAGRLSRQQLDRQESARRSEREEAVAARNQALREAASALKLLEREIERVDQTAFNAPFTFTDFCKRRFATAQTAVAYYLIVPAAMTHNIASAIAAANRLLTEFELDNLEVRTPWELLELRSQVRAALEHMSFTLWGMDFDYMDPFEEIPEPNGDDN